MNTQIKNAARRVPRWLWIAGPLLVVGFFSWQWLASGRAQIERLTAELGPAEAELVGRLEKMGYKGGAKLDSLLVDRSFELLADAHVELGSAHGCWIAECIVVF